LSEAKRTIAQTRSGERRVREGHKTQGFPVFGIAVASLVLGHFVTYAVVYPDPHRRGLELAASGHGYLSALPHLACILAAVAAATIVARAWGSPQRSTPSFVGLACALAVAQAGAFVGQEILERVLSGSLLHDLVSGPLLVFGVGAQVVLAVLGAAIATWLRRTTECFAESAPAARARPWRPQATLPLVAVDGGFAASDFVAFRPGRSPPSV
jgi:hypothetical protein